MLVERRKMGLNGRMEDIAVGYVMILSWHVDVE
jgi:hypothetical protein